MGKPQAKKQKTPPLRVVLQKCCVQALDDIEFVIDTGELLGKTLKASPFALIFTLKGAPSPASAVSFARRDWDLWEKSIKSVSVIVRRKCRDISRFQILKHRSGPLKQFWTEMDQSFK